MAASGASWFFHDEAIPLPPVARSKKQMAARGRVHMKRFALSVVMTGMLGLAAYTFSGAQPPSREPDGQRPRGGPGGGGIAALRGADLTEEQKAAI